jgi:hypothetical protein
MKFVENVLATFLGALLALVSYAVLTGKSSVLAKYIKDTFDVFDPSVDGFASMQLQGPPSQTVQFRLPAGTRKYSTPVMRIV